MAAQPYLLEGKLFGPREALELGWVDGLGRDGRGAARAGAGVDRGASRRRSSPGTARTTACPAARPAIPKIAAVLAVAPAVLRRRRAASIRRPQAILADDGRRRAGRLRHRAADRERATSPRSWSARPAKNMIQRVLLRPAARSSSGKSRPQGYADVASRQKVGILGAGMMGAGHRPCQRRRGIAMRAEGRVAEKAEAGLAAIRKITQPRRSRTAGSMRRASSRRCSRASRRPRTCAGARRLRPHHRGGVREPRAQGRGDARGRADARARRRLREQHLDAADHRAGAAASAQPEHFVGLHFFTPVRQDEAGRDHPRPEDRATRRSRAPTTTCRRSARSPIVVNDSRGFFTSRVFGTFVMEGAAMLAEGIAAPLVEHAGARRRHAGRPARGSRRDLAVALGARPRADARRPRAPKAAATSPRPASAGRTHGQGARPPGRAAGGGFYDYPAGRAEAPLAGAGDARSTKPGVAADIGELKQRLLYRQSIETARCLAEGVLTSAARRQHRLDLRHRLSGLDRRRDPVHRLGRPRHLSRQRRWPRSSTRRALRALRRDAQRCPRQRAHFLSGLRRSPPLPLGGGERSGEGQPYQSPLRSKGAKRGGSSPINLPCGARERSGEGAILRAERK